MPAQKRHVPLRGAQYYPDIEPVWYRAFASLRVGAERSRANAAAQIPLDFWGRTENERVARSVPIGTRRRFPGSPYGHSPAPEKSCSIAGVPAGRQRAPLPAGFFLFVAVMPGGPAVPIHMRSVCVALGSSSSRSSR
ncbi:MULTISPECIES: hypothetical protein [Burkholderia]|uniref:hypothetical protein n=1 Tax=Burkholderia TaxID=32008 RepID=UPI0015881206|nr:MULTISPECIES: hypothetical protein [Burkholderia]MBR8085009.1 hypothetical protein [Burkholderia vietnamiensis]MCA8227594.1 hypothetical protein [Burkholderia vietnamiensis]MCA8266124.1 hypothetical protein [Burkholderia vietnamiensis]MDN7666022.1 hypothetical protein [Burkholderia vietnamiensis]MDN7817559.1 hypothetical protein [Burkholderia vietnamiensis]